MAQSMFWVQSPSLYLHVQRLHKFCLFFFVSQKTIRDKEHRTFQMKLERLEKLFRALQLERNELREKVEVLKKKDSVKEADVNLATPVMQPCIALDSQKS